MRYFKAEDLDILFQLDESTGFVHTYGRYSNRRWKDTDGSFEYIRRTQKEISEAEFGTIRTKFLLGVED